MGAERPDDADWLGRLTSDGAVRDQALAELHAILLRIARSEMNRRAQRQVIDGPEADDLAHQSADDALIAIVRKLGDFRGESRFTTWAYKFVVLEVSSKLGRHFWRRPTTPMDDGDWERLPDRFGIGPAEHAQAGEFVVAVRRAVDEQLTGRQREVFEALVVHGIPLDALAVRLGSSRNAIYKTMFDARRKLRAALVANGHLPEPTGSDTGSTHDRAEL